MVNKGKWFRRVIDVFDLTNQMEIKVSRMLLYSYLSSKVVFEVIFWNIL